MKKNQLLGIAGALLVTAALGFIAGRTSNTENSITSEDSESQARSTSRDTRFARRNISRSAPENRGVSSRGSRDIKNTLRHIIAELERSPMANMDFDAMFGVWEIARDFSEDEVREALTSIGDIKNMQLRMTMEMMLMNRWGKINGSAAMEHAMSAENNQTRMMQIMGTLMSWTKEDPEAAFSWFEKNKESAGTGIYASAYQGMIYQAMARQDLNRALGHVDKIDNSQAKQTALSSIAQGVAEQPEKLKSFLNYLDHKNDPETKKLVMHSIISNLAMSNPESAKQYIKEIADDKERAKLVSTLVRGLSYTDPEEALKWGIEQTPNSDERIQMVQSTLRTWIAQDPNKAGTWYDKQPDNLKNDSIIADSARQLAATGQYEEAFSWIKRGQNKEAMDKSKSEAYQIWMQNSPKKAKAWLEGEGKEIMQGIDVEAIPESPQEAMPEGPQATPTTAS